MSDLAQLQQQLAQKEQEIAQLKQEIQEDKRLRELDEMRNTFVSTASHQLRTPLSVIKWVLSILQSDPELKKMESTMQMVDQAYQGVERIVDVVNDLLNVTRIKDGRLPFNPQKANPSELIEQSIKEMQPVAQSRSIDFVIDIQKDLPETTLDPILLREALHNLLNNALDYSGEKGKVTLTATKQENNLAIVVTNTGPGIKKEDDAKIFEPFFRSADALMLHPDGSGLGLYLTKAIATEHGGHVSYQSEPNKETVFTLTFPLVTPE